MRQSWHPNRPDGRFFIACDLNRLRAHIDPKAGMLGNFSRAGATLPVRPATKPPVPWIGGFFYIKITPPYDRTRFAGDKTPITARAISVSS